MIGNYPMRQDYTSLDHHHCSPNDHLQPALVQVCPSIYYGNLNSLSDRSFANHNFKIIVNCLPTYKFLNRLDHQSHGVSLSSDVIVLSLDLGFDINKYSEHEKQLLDEFTSTYNKVLQNFMSFFVTYNDNISNHIHGLPNNLNLNLQHPILTGNLKNNLFKLIRIIKLFKIINSSIEVLVVGEFNENCSKALLIGYLMDNYNYNLNACLHYLSGRVALNFNSNYYNDLLILENLKKFYRENSDIKSGSSVLFNNKDGKRARDDDGVCGKRARWESGRV
ncbi:hypothetical protein PSN45_004169 [Yamadazyma tenuis]|uniref:Uncharacterized protein n=1 Tax=Candida tenuis (strain ATCC 10573 / BCRC 21748 / CBS 615 / JCM 9827 / NBRC 10315 / NRRL Y-1498 / VKM Y-70) TaxID=590646 RepID=G3B429_CANTC|nr:uncharacterized protein CANTEDRAFT_113804 [Yamadazyma tenuis ATCC 10573]EGV63757.1 hypothetical protein CANTEDRAFT_113804 [Yamadazyma tenuis ATCC 10573]WEJ96628.1 hypothetical protein PSN45_004169 [Yamadazyma tenuis]